MAKAQVNDQNVTGSYTLAIDENSNLTLGEAKHKAIENAKAEAIKAAFGTMVITTTELVNEEVNGSTSSQFREVTRELQKGDWMRDTAPAKISVDYNDNTLFITAEVAGVAREVTQVKPNIDWKIIGREPKKKNETDTFNNKDKIYMSFRSEVNGYAAVFLLEESNNATVLVPFAGSGKGNYKIDANKDYMFFDPERDASFRSLEMTTRHPLEYNEVVIVFSTNPFPNPFVKSGNSRSLNRLTITEFNNWQVNSMNQDRSMFVDRKRIKIINSSL